MKILLTNDDGVFAPGIAAMAEVLEKNKYDSFVVAPNRERSSVGHAITLHRPLRLWRVENGPYPVGYVTYACDGTPSDSVVLAVEELETGTDLVVSGINRGPNVGDDLTYSGTVSAAMEGVILGCPAIAVSLNSSREDEEEYYETAAHVVCGVIEWIRNNPLPKGILLNINVPNVPLSLLKGIKVTRKGVRIYEGKVTRLNDPHGRVYYWISGRPEDQLVEGCDVWALARGYVSITPIHMDMTCYEFLDHIQEGGLESIPIGK
jgi:5'-nucleotidase